MLFTHPMHFGISLPIALKHKINIEKSILLVPNKYRILKKNRFESNYWEINSL